MIHCLLENLAGRNPWGRDEARDAGPGALERVENSEPGGTGVEIARGET